jgi:hypothetical protein
MYVNMCVLLCAVSVSVLLMCAFVNVHMYVSVHM